MPRAQRPARVHCQGHQFGNWVELELADGVGCVGLGLVVVVVGGDVGGRVGEGRVGVGFGVRVVVVGGGGGASVVEVVVDVEVRVDDDVSPLLEVSELVVPVIGGPGGIGGAVV
ncbi:hypothetical protein [Saccharopolyspora rhizosphaerae]|uniref:hypothetical protein n=1 Tax=Saccharopolyspora rhizosphaerae TaxID=2492662 RepID=UPI0018F7BAFA|nr:hypothetical protein [Saccharopolyspora rhizosphaerae]